MTKNNQPENLSSLLSSREWWVTEDAFDVNKINFYETIFTVGNGYLGTRGSLEGTHTAAFPQTFISGVFDHNDSTITHLVTAPDWIPLHIIANNERLCMQNSKVIEFYRILDMHHGLLYRFTRFQDPSGNITRLETLRYASFADQHLCEIKAIITPENYSGQIIVRSEINGHMFNIDRIPVYPNQKVLDPEIKWEKWAKSKHLAHIVSKTIGDDILYLEMKTLDRPHRIGYGIDLQVLNDKSHITCVNDYERIYHSTAIDGKKGKPIHIEKLVSIYTTRDVDRSKITQSCKDTLQENRKKTFTGRFAEHKKIWQEKWDSSDCRIIGDAHATHATRFCLYHLLITANKNDPKTNIGAKSMSGEGYKGHIFWDTEIFTLPFYVYTQPETARSLMMYRYNTLQGARENAIATGYKGARYPWESADFGHEECPKWSADGVNRIWPGEEEIHITADVVRGLFTYFISTNDVDFMLDYGTEIVFETARFWASRLEYNKEKDYYELTSVIGPDEYHEHVNNNVFTNWMARWNLQKAIEIYHWLESQNPNTLERLQKKIQLLDEEINNWKEIAHKVYILYDSTTKLFEEFENYFQLRDITITQYDELGMPLYPEGLNDFNTGNSTLVKQADVLALLYVLSDEFDFEVKKVNYDYYAPKTMHASSLSTSIHSIMAIETRNPDQALKYFQHTAYLDLHDHKHSTDTGIHIAAAGGTWQSVVCGFGGMRIKNQMLTFNPWLPTNWQEIQYKIMWRGDSVDVKVRHDEADFFWHTKLTEPLEIEIVGKPAFLRPNQSIVLKYVPETLEVEIEHPQEDELPSS